MQISRRFLRDLIERVLSTYVQAFCTFLIASGIGVTGVVDMSTLKKAGVAAIAGVLATIKAMLARQVGDPQSASLAKPPIIDAPPDTPNERYIKGRKATDPGTITKRPGK